MTALARHKAKPAQRECLANAQSVNHADSKDRHMTEGETRLYGRTLTLARQQKHSLDYCFATSHSNLHLPAEADMTVTRLLRHPLTSGAQAQLITDASSCKV